MHQSHIAGQERDPLKRMDRVLQTECTCGFDTQSMHPDDGSSGIARNAPHHQESTVRGASRDEALATSNVDRSYTLGGTSIAIFSFVLFFLYPEARRGEASLLLFQTTIVVMAVATFSFVFATLHYYRASVGSQLEGRRTSHSHLGDRFWLLGYSLLFLAPSLVLFTIGLAIVGSVWLALWALYSVFIMRHYPGIRTRQRFAFDISSTGN